MKLQKNIDKTVAKQVGLLLFTIIIVLGFNFENPIADHIELRLQFFLRELVNPPDLDKRIKIFNFDDTTTIKLNKFDIKLKSWARIFKAIDASKPNAIFIDKLFDTLNFSAKDIAGFNKVMATVKTPVIPISFVRNKKLGFRDIIDPDSLGRQEFFPSAKYVQDYLPGENTYIYGAHPDIRAQFSAIGHAVYEGNNYIHLLKKTDNNHALPHWSVFAADTISYADNEIIINGNEVPSRSDSQILVNTLSSKTLFAESRRLLSLIFHMIKGTKIKTINEGDYVVILPAMYTGNTDWRESALGSVPGGFIMTSMINSVISNSWITEFTQVWILILLALIAAVLCGKYLANGLIPASLITGTTYILSSFSAFVFFNYSLPWVLPTMVFALAIAIFLSFRARKSQAEHIRMEAELTTAKLVQESFFPPLDANRLKIHSLFTPSTECGGDWWGHFRVDDDHEFVIVADATGHGVGAALVTAMSFSLVHTAGMLIKEGKIECSPKAVLDHINSALAASASGKTTMTMTVLCFDFLQSKIISANAGHCYPFLIPADAKRMKGKNKCLQLSNNGVPLGFQPELDSLEKSFDFEVGDKILLFSDGIYENPDKSGKVWGIRKFRKTINKYHERPVPEIISAIEKDSVAHLGGFPQEDDVTIIGVDIL